MKSIKYKTRRIILYAFLGVIFSSCNQKEKITCDYTANGLYNCTDNNVNYIVDSVLSIKGIRVEGFNFSLKKNNNDIITATKTDSINRPILIFEFNNDGNIKELRSINYSFDEQIIVSFSKENILTQVFYNATFKTNSKEWKSLYHLEIDIKSREMTNYFYYYYKGGYQIMDSEIESSANLNPTDSIILRYTTHLVDLSSNELNIENAKLLKNSLFIDIDSTLVLGSLKVFEKGNLIKNKPVILRGNLYNRMLQTYSEKAIFPVGNIEQNMKVLEKIKQSNLSDWDSSKKIKLKMNTDNYEFIDSSGNKIGK